MPPNIHCFYVVDFLQIFRFLAGQTTHNNDSNSMTDTPLRLRPCDEDRLCTGRRCGGWGNVKVLTEISHLHCCGGWGNFFMSHLRGLSHFIMGKLPSGWWLNQPLWKIWVKMGIFPKYGWKKQIFETTNQPYFIWVQNLRSFQGIPGGGVSDPITTIEGVTVTGRERRRWNLPRFHEVC